MPFTKYHYNFTIEKLLNFMNIPLNQNPKFSYVTQFKKEEMNIEML
jgi:hypothetical protein